MSDSPNPLLDLLPNQSGPLVKFHPYFSLVLDIRQVHQISLQHSTVQLNADPDKTFRFETEEQAAHFMEFLHLAKQQYEDSVKPTTDIDYYISSKLAQIEQSLLSHIDLKFENLNQEIASIQPAVSKTLDTISKQANQKIENHLAKTHSTIQAALRNSLNLVPEVLKPIAAQMETISGYLNQAQHSPFETDWRD